MVDQPIGQVERRNLAAVANLLTHVAAQDDPSSLKDRFVRVPLQEYIKSEGPIFRDWIMDGELNTSLDCNQLNGSGRC
jgi:Ras GTPase-activating-like protein IQGAP2/3